MLRHRTVRLVRAPLEVCLRCVADPERFLAASRYTYFVKRVGPDVYEVVFRWRKLGMTRFYRVLLRVRASDGSVSYESTEESDYPFKLSFRLTRSGDATRVEVYSEMDAGLMASLLGRGDYARFIEELVDRGIVALARRLAGEQAASWGRPSCTTCLLYDLATRRCLVLGERVEDPEKPPCKGEDFIPVDALERLSQGGR